MEVYIIYTEKERYGTKIGTQTVEVISHCMLNKQEIIDVDAHLRLPDGMSTNILVPCSWTGGYIWARMRPRSFIPLTKASLTKHCKTLTKK